MAEDLFDIVEHALLITGFVLGMMLLIEYLNVLTRGGWHRKLSRHRWGQYLAAGVLGVTPGCLGAFAVVAMYTHRTVSVGALVTAMIASTGDAAFVMLGRVPRDGLLVMAILFVLSIPVGLLTDLLVGRRRTTLKPGQQEFEVHDEACEFYARGQLLHQWRHCIAARGILVAVLALFGAAVATGQVGAGEETWIRITIMVLSAIALFIVTTVPDHFLEEHLWKHVARKHVLKVFLWTLGALLFLHLAVERLDWKDAIEESRGAVLLVACLLGCIPDSGPHIVFVTLYAAGTAPFSALLAISIVQDGHGMLPLLAHSRRAFFGVKAVNFAVGLVVGAVVMLLGY